MSNDAASTPDPAAAPNVIYGEGILADGSRWKNNRYLVMPPTDTSEVDEP